MLTFQAQKLSEDANSVILRQQPKQSMILPSGSMDYSILHASAWLHAVFIESGFSDWKPLAFLLFGTMGKHRISQ